jgi:ABC-type transporter Mla MlaB component
MTTSTAWATPQMVRTPGTGAKAATSFSPGRKCLLEVSGPMTWRTSRRLHARFRRAVDAGGRELRVDLRRVSEVDLAGMAVLLVYARLLPTLGGILRLSNVSPACRELMHEMQLSHLLNQVPARGGGDDVG